jgi:hypothetical protein
MKKEGEIKEVENSNISQISTSNSASNVQQGKTVHSVQVGSLNFSLKNKTSNLEPKLDKCHT